VKICEDKDDLKYKGGGYDYQIPGPIL
jgi:hypothetical protein